MWHTKKNIKHKTFFDKHQYPTRLCAWLYGPLSSNDIYQTHPKTTNLIRNLQLYTLEEIRTQFISSTNFEKIISPIEDKQIELMQIKRRTTICNSPPRNSDQKRGIELESEALEAFARTTSKLVYDLKKFASVHGKSRRAYAYHPDHPFLISSPDGLTSCGCLVEIKCPRSFYKSIPREHRLQMLFDMCVCGFDACFYVQYVKGEGCVVNKVTINDEVYNKHLFTDSLNQMYEFFSNLSRGNNVLL
jgi:hypothetical protein